MERSGNEGPVGTSPAASVPPSLDGPELLYYKMALVRRFEERVLELFAAGELTGTTHCYIGQEANAVAVIEHLAPCDLVVSNHRCHGHYLVRTGDVEGLLVELMGRVGGPCSGRGGSQHLCSQGFYTNGIQGSIVPVAAGMAFAEKTSGTGAVTVVFIGDGTFGQGVVYETFNMISLWHVPLLVVVEDNRYAQSTPLEASFAGGFVERAGAFGLSAGESESNDVQELHDRFATVLRQFRARGEPHVEVLHTYRLCAHSKGDDHRPTEEVEAWRRRDPLAKQAGRLAPGRREALEERVSSRIAEAERWARGQPFPTWEDQPRARRCRRTRTAREDPESA